MEPVITFTDRQATPLRPLRLPASFSFSMLDTYRSCPAKWMATKRVERTVQAEDPLVTGGIVHGMLQLAVQQPQVDEPDWPRLAREAIRMLRMEREQRGWGDDPTPAVELEDGRWTDEEYWATAAVLKLDGFRLSDALGHELRPAGVEEQLAGEWEGVGFNGRGDYRDQSGVLVDWKTGRIPSNSRHADQLRLYTHLYRQNGVSVDSAFDVYVEHRDRRPVDLSDDMMDHTLHGLVLAARRLARDVEANRYGYKPGGLCGWCPLANVCPAAHVVSAKALAQAHGQPIQAGDPRFPLLTPAVDACERVECATSTADEATIRKEPIMTGTDSLLSLLTGGGAPTPVSTANPQSAEWTANPPAVTPQADPWDTEPGREAMAAWGINTGTTTPATPATPAPTVVVATPETTGPATPVTPSTVTQPAQPPMASAPAIQPAAHEPYRFEQHRPYDPTWLGADTINIAGYGWLRRQDLLAHAIQLANGNMEQVTPILQLLSKAVWSISRTVYGTDATPDIPGLKDGRPQTDVWLAWLDTTMARDSACMLGVLLDLQPDGEDVKTRVGRAARDATRSMSMANALL